MSDEEIHRAAVSNLARLRSLAGAPPGLVVAAITGTPAGLPPAASVAAGAVAVVPGMAFWVWRASEDPGVIARDLAAARASFGEGVRAVLVLRPRARVLREPSHGEVGAAAEGVDAVPLMRAVSALQEDELVLGVGLPWSDEARETVARAGFVAPSSAT